MTDRRRLVLGVVAVVGVAVALRTLPLYRSPLPFNPDGIYHARWAAAATGDGALPLDRLATDDIHFVSLLAVAATVVGVEPLLIGQPVAALIGAAPALLGVALGRRLAVRRGWSVRRSGRAGLLAGLLLAVEGLYLHRSTATDEQTVGLLLVPLALVAIWRARRTDRRSWWLVAAVLLVVLPAVHNLDATIAALALVVLAGVSFVLAGRPDVERSEGRPTRGLPVGSSGRLLGVAAAFAAVLVGYHLAVSRYTPATIAQEDRLLDVPGLVVAWLVLVAVGGAWLARSRVRTRRLAGGSLFVVPFGLLAANATTTVFPGTPSTSRVLLVLVLPLSVPAGLAVWQGASLWAPDGDGPALVALGGGVLAVVGVALTAALTPEYLATAYRASTFLHLPVLVAAGVGTAAVLGRDGVRARPARRVLVACLVVVASVASIPVAFGGLALLPYKGVTTPGEYAAAEFGASYAAGRWASDDHVGRVAGAIDGGRAGTPAPVYAWLVGGRHPPRCLAVVQRSWTTAGAQVFPAPPARLPVAAYRRWQLRRSVVYHGGAADPIRAGLPAGGVDGVCRGAASGR